MDTAVIRLCDELYGDAIVSEETWDFLSTHFTRHELIDLLVTVGQYNMVSMALNALGVELEEGKTGSSEFVK